MFRIWFVLASIIAVPAHADAPAAKLSITSKRDSKDPPPKAREVAVKRTTTGIELSIHGNGSLCLATWTLRDTVIHAESNLDAPAMPSCTIVLAVSPWPAKADVGVQLDNGKVERFRVP